MPYILISIRTRSPLLLATTSLTVRVSMCTSITPLGLTITIIALTTALIATLVHPFWFVIDTAY